MGNCAETGDDVGDYDGDDDGDDVGDDDGDVGVMMVNMVATMTVRMMR